MDRSITRAWRLCFAATLLLVLAGCSARMRQGMLDGYDHAGYASPCGAAFIGYHGPVERCVDEAD